MEMPKIICIANQKGGVGKTTTAINLSASLAFADRSVLLIDFDPQGNASTGMGVNKSEITSTIYNALVGKEGIANTIKTTEVVNLHIIPANIDLIGAELELVDVAQREGYLKEILLDEVERYEYIIIDCPPSLGLLTINALTAADSVLIPIQCEYFALEGLGQLLNTIRLVRKSSNPNLAIEGILLTMFDSRTVLSNQVVSEVKDHFGRYLFKTIIPRNVRLSEASSYGKPIMFYDIKSKGADAYFDLAKEIMVNAKTCARQGSKVSYT